MELILGILGLLCALYFALLVSIGMDFSWIWLVGAVLFWGIAAVHKYTVLHSIVIAKGLKIAAIAVFAIGLLVFVIAEGCIVSRMSAEPKENLDYMSRPRGTGCHGERPSRALKLRLEKGDTGVGTLREADPALSGGQGDGESITEAECMKRFLVEKGIPEDKMILEDESVSTMEICSSVHDCQTAKKRRPGSSATIFNVYRALKLAKKQGYQDVCGVAAGSDWRYQIHYMVREAFALVKEKIKGNI